MIGDVVVEFSKVQLYWTIYIALLIGRPFEGYMILFRFIYSIHPSSNKYFNIVTQRP